LHCSATAVNKSKSDQGQEEEFIAMLNPMFWSKGIVMELLLNCYNL